LGLKYSLLAKKRAYWWTENVSQDFIKCKIVQIQYFTSLCEGHTSSKCSWNVKVKIGQILECWLKMKATWWRQKLLSHSLLIPFFWSFETRLWIIYLWVSVDIYGPKNYILD